MTHGSLRNGCCERLAIELLNRNIVLLQMFLCAVLLLGCMTGSTSAIEVPVPVDLLKALRAKDAKFDNVKLDYVTSGEVKPSLFLRGNIQTLPRNKDGNMKSPKSFPSATMRA